MKVTLAALAATACLMLSGAIYAGPVSGQGTWEATLLPRDLNADGAVDAFYDTVRDITWLRDWNRAVDIVFDQAELARVIQATNAIGGIDGHLLTAADFSHGFTWWGAMAWAANLVEFGFDDWRLPTTTQPDPTCSNQFLLSRGYDCTGSELGWLFHEHLGNVRSYTPTNTGDFQGMGGIPRLWTSTGWVGSTGIALTFDFTNGGEQDGGIKNNVFFAVAVRDGDFTPVHEPMTPLLLVAAGLVSLLRSQAWPR